MPKTLTNKALQDAAKELGIELAAMRAVDEIESRGEGFTDDGHVKILFERHKFHQFTHGRFDESHPDISNKAAGGYGRGSQYARFSRAFALDPDAAMKSASWGRYQIMGFNYKAAGFNTVGEFVDAMKISEDEHLKAFVKVIKAWGLAPELRSHDWAAFASQYNGEDYRKNQYDKKLAAAYEKFKNQAFIRDEDAPSDPVEPTTEPEEKKEPPVETVSSKPPVVEVKNQGASWTTKIAAATSAVTPILTATGLKIGGIQFSTGALYAFAAVVIVGLIVGAVIYDRGQQRAWERQKLGMMNMADPNKANVVAGSGS